MTDRVADSNDKQLNTDLMKKFKTSMPFFKNRTAFFLDNNDWDDDAKDIEFCDKEVQTENIKIETDTVKNDTENKTPTRSLEECLDIYKSNLGADGLTDEEVIMLVKNKTIASYQIEKAVNNPERGVGIRRKIVGESGKLSCALVDLPYKNYDYSKVSVKRDWFFFLIMASVSKNVCFF